MAIEFLGSARPDEHTIRLRALRQGCCGVIVQAATADDWPRRPVVFPGGLLPPTFGPPFPPGPVGVFPLSSAIPAVPKGPYCALKVRRVVWARAMRPTV